ISYGVIFPMKTNTSLGRAVWLAVGVCIVYYVGSSLLYSIEVARFYGLNATEMKLTPNGKGWGNLISVRDLQASKPTGTINELCSDVTPITRDHRSISVNESGIMVCCATDNFNDSVPFKDVNGQRHYLCGKWPTTNEVSQPIKLSKLKLYGTYQ
ncbi:hypothetical protein REH76_04630, partial [Photobacterium damselae]